MINQRKSRAWYLPLVLLLLALAQGCVVGSVVDANTGAAIDGVTVTILSGKCQKGVGVPCTTLTQTTRTIEGLGFTFNGAFAFDAEGGVTPDNIQKVTPATGEEAVLLQFSRAGYQTMSSTSMAEAPLARRAT